MVIGPIRNPTTDSSWRSGFWSKFDNFLIVVNWIRTFFRLEPITFNLFFIKRSKKTIQLSICNKLYQKRWFISKWWWKWWNPVIFDHFWLNLTNFNIIRIRIRNLRPNSNWIIATIKSDGWNWKSQLKCDSNPMWIKFWL